MKSTKGYILGLSIIVWATLFLFSPLNFSFAACNCAGQVLCEYNCGGGTCDYLVPCPGTTSSACETSPNDVCLPGDDWVSQTCNWNCAGGGDVCDNNSGGTCPGDPVGSDCSGGNGVCIDPDGDLTCTCQVSGGGNDTAPSVPTNVNPPASSSGWGSTVTYGYNVSSWGSCSSGNINRSNVFQTTVPISSACPAKPYSALAGCTNVTDSTNPINCPSTPLSRAQATKYCWYASATNGCLTSATSPIWMYTTCNPTNPSVSLSSPANGAAISSTSIALSWSGVFGTGCWSNANDYTVYRATKTASTCPSSFSTEAPGCTGLTTQTTCTTTGLTVGSSYCWKVTGTNGSLSMTTPTWEFCYGSNPTAPTLFSPPSDTGVAIIPPTLDWNAVSSWGNSCGGGGTTNRYRAYTTAPTTPGVCPALTEATINAGTWTQKCNIDADASGATDCSALGLSPNTDYCWGVGASNNDFAPGTNTYSARWIFRTPVTVSGTFWDATGDTTSCDTPDGLGAISTDADAKLETYGTGGSNYENNIGGTGNFSLSSVVVPPAHISMISSLSGSNLDVNPNDSNLFQLSCYRGDSVPAGSVTINDIRTDNTNHIMGFAKAPTDGWTQTLLGDIFMNCSSCAPYGIYQSIPPLGSPYDSDAYMIDTSSALSGSSGLAITYGAGIQADDWSSSQDKISSGSLGSINYNIPNYDGFPPQPKHLSFPSNISFTSPPTTATQLTTASLNPSCATFLTTSASARLNTTYYITAAEVSCFTTMISANRSFNFGGGTHGIVVLYVTAPLNVTFNNTIKAAPGSFDRLILVINGSVAFPGTFPTGVQGAFDQTTPGDIQATIIAKNGIISQSNGNNPADDKTLIVDGSLLTPAGILMGRNKGVNNTSPSELIRFAPRDVMFLNTAEMGATVTGLEHTGLHTYKVEWEVE